MDVDLSTQQTPNDPWSDAVMAELEGDHRAIGLLLADAAACGQTGIIPPWIITVLAKQHYPQLDPYWQAAPGVYVDENGNHQPFERLVLQRPEHIQKKMDENTEAIAIALAVSDIQKKERITQKDAIDKVSYNLGRCDRLIQDCVRALKAKTFESDTIDIDGATPPKTKKKQKEIIDLPPYFLMKARNSAIYLKACQTKDKPPRIKLKPNGKKSI